MTAVMDVPHQFAIGRWPQNDDELWSFVRAVWGTTIPRTRVCPNHCSPFEAFADAYFARYPITVWKASRGFGGKTHTLGMLGQTEACALSAQVSILGGSSAQSRRVYEAGEGAWQSPHAPAHLLSKPPTQHRTDFKSQAWIETLMASQRSVRGTHPQRLRMDEIDEMDLEILTASLGTVMEGRRGAQMGVETQIVMSSTHQYPDKTMSAILERAEAKGWPVYEWCYKECSNPIDGWLTQKEIQTKKDYIPDAMWDAEYDLQEPSFEGRAIDTDAVHYAFSEALGTTDETTWTDPTYAPDHALHVTGIDWAKERDLTVITTFDACEPDEPWRCVAWSSFNRVPWPVQVARAENRYRRYRGYLAHDATGIGNVLADYIDPDLRRRNRMRMADVVLSGGIRATLFTDYISALEDGMIVYPRIEQAYKEHLYVTMNDLFGSGHPPDSIVAGAVAWGMRSRLMKPKMVAPMEITRESDPFDLSTRTN